MIEFSLKKKKGIITIGFYLHMELGEGKQLPVFFLHLQYKSYSVKPGFSVVGDQAPVSLEHLFCRFSCHLFCCYFANKPDSSAFGQNRTGTLPRKVVRASGQSKINGLFSGDKVLEKN